MKKTQVRAKLTNRTTYGADVVAMFAIIAAKFIPETRTQVGKISTA